MKIIKSHQDPKITPVPRYKESHETQSNHTYADLFCRRQDRRALNALRRRRADKKLIVRPHPQTILLCDCYLTCSCSIFILISTIILTLIYFRLVSSCLISFQACLICTILSLAIATIVILVAWFTWKDTMSVNPFKVYLLMKRTVIIIIFFVHSCLLQQLG